jgi:hypothetical protein
MNEHKAQQILFWVGSVSLFGIGLFLGTSLGWERADRFWKEQMSVHGYGNYNRHGVFVPIWTAPKTIETEGKLEDASGN